MTQIEIGHYGTYVSGPDKVGALAVEIDGRCAIEYGELPARKLFVALSKVFADEPVTDEEMKEFN